MATPVRRVAEVSGQHGHAIARLADDLNVPVSKVAEVYQAELDQIGTSARIHHYLSVLATRRARAVLRNSKPLTQ